MTIEKSFVKAVCEVGKRYPVLKQPIETKVQITLTSLIQICREFHKQGYDDGDVFTNLFGLRK